MHVSIHEVERVIAYSHLSKDILEHVRILRGMHAVYLVVTATSQIRHEYTSDELGDNGKNLRCHNRPRFRLLDGNLEGLEIYLTQSTFSDDALVNESEPARPAYDAQKTYCL